MCKNLFAVLCWVIAINGQYYDDFDDLGDRIRAKVAAQVKPLEGLGERINARVQQNLEAAQFRDPFFNNPEPVIDVRGSPVPKDDFRNELPDLSGLGQSISDSVYESLEPVRAIALNFNKRDGVGGTTIVTHRPSGRQFLVRNYEMFSCSSPIDTRTGHCPGALTGFKITKSSPQSDWCFLRSYSQANNHVCLSTGSVIVSANNNRVTCRSTDEDKPSLLITLDEYKRMCSSISKSAEYRYIPNENDPDHVEIPNKNRYVKCENRQKNYCIFNEENGLLNTFGFRDGGNVVYTHNKGNVAYF